MHIEQISGLRVRLTGGDGHGGRRLVVLLHGFGAPGDDLVALSDHLGASREVLFAFPEAPLALPAAYGTGRAWWMIDMERLQRDMAMGRPRDLSSETPPGLAESRSRIVDVLGELERRTAIEPGRVVLGGFSQGAMLACDVALRTGRTLAGLVLMSGTLLARAEWQPLMSTRRGLPVFLSHGTADPLLPFAMAERLRALLTEAGLDVHWVPFRGGHEITPGVLSALGTFLRRTLTEGLR